jgi:chromosome segregation ATPase
MGDRLDPDALFARGFKAGSIIRLRMKNFLTYDECEFFTGPRLNIVIGPNGTGKSALTHAICLACCGSTGDVGRSNDLSKFVKHGAEGQESFAEVDILTAERTLVTIRRVINSENKGSKWFVNGRHEKQAEVKKLVSGLSIDVDNLCSFMPQDKVGSFSRFTPKEILANTLKAIQDPQDEFSLADEQIELSKIQDNKEEYRRRRDAKQASVDSSQRELGAMKGQMVVMERREEVQQLLQDYEVRLLAAEVGELSDRFAEMQEQKDQKAALLQEERRRVGPLEQRERDLRRQQAARDKAVDDAVNMQKRIDDVLRTRTAAVDQREVDVDSMSQELVTLGKERQAKEATRNATEQRLADAQEMEAAALAQMPEIDAQIRELRALTDQLGERKAEEEDKARHLESRCSELREEVAAGKRALAGLQDFKQLYKQRLQRAAQGPGPARGALAMLEFLEKNQDQLRQTGQLRGEVYGPVSMYCSVADSACATMVEKAIPVGRLLGFVTQCDEDATFLKDQRERCNWSVNIFTMKNAVIDGRRAYTDQQIAQLGLKGYLCDQLECPDVIRSYLYVFSGLNKVLWGRGADNLSQKQQEDMCRREGSFKVYLHEVRPGQQQTGMNQNIVEYQGRMSRNPNAPPSTSSIGVSGKGFIVNKSGDDDAAMQRQNLQQSLRNNEGLLRQAEAQLTAQQGVVRTVTGELQSVRGEMQKRVQAKREPALYRQKVVALQKTVDDLNQQLAVSAGRERQEKEATYREAVQSLLDAVRGAAEAAQKSLAARVDREVATALQHELVDAIREAEAALREGQKTVADLTKDLKAFEKECGELEKRKLAKEGELDQVVHLSGMDHRTYAEQVYSKVSPRVICRVMVYAHRRGCCVPCVP